jgi:hypothetical protein
MNRSQQYINRLHGGRDALFCLPVGMLMAEAAKCLPRAEVEGRVRVLVDGDRYWIMCHNKLIILIFLFERPREKSLSQPSSLTHMYVITNVATAA